MKTKIALSLNKHTCALMIGFTAFISGQAHGQSNNQNNLSPITLNSDNYIVPPLADYFMQGANASGVSIPKSGTDQTWDYSLLEKNDAFNFSTSYTHVNNAAFSNATREHDFIFALGGIIALRETGYEAADNNSFRRVGKSLALQKFPLQLLTGSKSDSLIFQQQEDFDKGTFAFITYPCTISSSWSNTVRVATRFELSISAFGYDHTQGQFVQRQTLTRSVIGSGRMRVPAGDGKTPYVDVLMIRSTLTTIDSTYINDQPASDALLAAFGLTQGEASSENCYVFFRQGIDEPLITFNMDNSFSSIASVQYDTKYADIYCGNKEKICDNGMQKCIAYSEVTPALLQSDLVTIGQCVNKFVNRPSTKNIAATALQSIRAFPNPTHSQFTLNFNNNTGQTINIRIMDVTGRVLLQLKTNTQQITFGDQLKRGVYFAEVINGNKKEAITLVKL